MTLTDDDIRQAARILEAGGLVAFPTETVYGLGADAENPAAIAKIYAAKGRPSNHPLIVHLASEADISDWSDEVPEVARKLIAAFWPGPLTLILKRSARVQDSVTGGQDSIGLRCPSHPVAQALLRAFKKGKGGVAAPSANRFGHVSPTTAQHVQNEFGNDARIDAILDGGQSEVGIESTILDLSRWETHGPVLLRPGHIGAERIAEVIGIMPAMPDMDAPRASGSLDAHYAPRTPVVLIAVNQMEAQLIELGMAGRRVAVMFHSAPAFGGAVLNRKLPSDAAGYAHDLYAALRALDEADADVIVVEAPSQDVAWQGVNDRLRRATHDSSGLLAQLTDA
jgi:L-threonylcarbamoyladenylate synthase